MQRLLMYSSCETQNLASPPMCATVHLARSSGPHTQLNAGEQRQVLETATSRSKRSHVRWLTDNSVLVRRLGIRSSFGLEPSMAVQLIKLRSHSCSR